MDENNKDDIIEVEKVTDNEVQKVEQVNQDEENKKEEQQEVKNAEVVNEKTKNQVEEEKDRKGYCIASLVLGIVSLVLLFVSYISVPCAITAIIFGAIGIKSKNKGMAIGGLVTAIISFLIEVLIVIFTLILGLSLIFDVKDYIINQDMQEDNVNNSYYDDYDYDYDYNSYLNGRYDI